MSTDRTERPVVPPEAGEIWRRRRKYKPHTVRVDEVDDVGVTFSFALDGTDERYFMRRSLLNFAELYEPVEVRA